MSRAQTDGPDFAASFATLAAQASPPGLAAGVLRADGSVQILTHGVIYKGSDVPVGPDALWHLGSITKSFTATMIMRLDERGVLSLDQTLAELLPDYRDEMHPDWQAITLEQLLSHTAGLPANFGLRAMIATYDKDLTAARLKLLRRHWAKPLPGKPGDFLYSNMGYVLAGFVAETRTATPWRDLIRREIARPLGLGSLGFGPPTGDTDPRGHRGWLIKRAVAPDARGSDNPAWLGPAGTLHMNLRDLLAWGQVQIRACRGEMPEFLSAQGCARLHRPVTEGYALGWAVQALQGLEEPLIGHDGSNTMWLASIKIFPEHGTVLAYTMNEADFTFGDKLGAGLEQAVRGFDKP